MKFANPQFLWALFSLIVPILIHLFHFRRFKTVYFTNVRFLRELKKETQSRSKIRRILILLARCSALAALVIAFARPYIPGSNSESKGDKSISIYIDNSFSMDARSESSSLLELARKYALEIVESYGVSDRFQLITNELEGRQMQWLTKEQFNERIEEITSSALPRQTDKIIERQLKSIRESGRNGVVYLLSDFQKSSTRFEKLRNDSSVSIHLIQLNSGISDNISLDSCWFETPYRESDKADKLLFNVKNYSGNRFDNLPVKLTIDGTERGLESISSSADSSIQSTVAFTTPGKGFHQGELKLSDYPVSFDDVLYFTYNIPDKIHILNIQGKPDRNFLSKLYSSQEIFDFKSVNENNIDYSVFPSTQVIVLEELQKISSGLILELGKFVKAGGTLVVLPDPEQPVNELNQLSAAVSGGNITFGAASAQSQKVSQINQQHPLFDDVFERKQENIDLPEVKRFISFRARGGAEDAIMKLQGGDHFLASYPYQKGVVYFAASSLNPEHSNFARHALFIPTFYKLALYSMPQSRLYYYPGEDGMVEINKVSQNTELPVRIVSADNSFEAIPEQRNVDGRLVILTRNSVTQAGNYQLFQGDSLLGAISFNYNRKESNPGILSSTELETLTQDAGLVNVKISDGSDSELAAGVLLSDQGRQYWKLFVILALLFLAIEILLIRLK